MSHRTLNNESPGLIQLGDLVDRRLGFGAMWLSGVRNSSSVEDRSEAVRLVRRAADRGVTFFDTANIYGGGQSEEILAEALYPYPAGLVVGTKAGFRPGKILSGHATLPPRGDPDDIRHECELSLRRLRVDCLDLYQVHTPDPAVPYAETVGAFAELQRQGKVRHIGISNVSVAQLQLARSVCDIVSVQNRYNAASRGSDRVLAACEEAGIAFLPWQPVSARARPVHVAITDVAARRGASAQQVALAWLLRRSPQLLPIPGTSSVDHLDDNLDAAWLQLTETDYEQIDAVSRQLAGLS